MYINKPTIISPFKDDKNNTRSLPSVKKTEGGLHFIGNFKSIYNDGLLSQNYKSYISFGKNVGTKEKDLQAFITKLREDVANNKYEEINLTSENLDQEIISVLNEYNYGYFEKMANSKLYMSNSLNPVRPYFYADDIHEQLKAITAETRGLYDKYFDKLINAKSLKDGDSRYYSGDIKELLEHLRKYNSQSDLKTFDKLFNYKLDGAREYCFRSEELMNLVQLISNTPDQSLKDILDLTLKANTLVENNYRFSDYEHKYILKSAIKGLEEEDGRLGSFKTDLIKKLITQKTLDKKDYRFRGNLCYVVDAINTFNVKYLNHLLNAKDVDENRHLIKLDEDVDLYKLFDIKDKENDVIELEANVLFDDFLMKEKHDRKETFKAKIKNKNTLLVEESSLLYIFLKKQLRKEGKILGESLKINDKEYNCKTKECYKYRYEAYDIASILKNIKLETYKLYEYMLKARDTKRNKPKFKNAGAIKTILETFNNSRLATLKHLANTKHYFWQYFGFSDNEMASISRLYEFEKEIPLKKIIEGKTINDFTKQEKYKLINFYKADHEKLFETLRKERLSLPGFPVENDQIQQYPGKLLYSIYLFGNFKFNTHLVKPALQAIEKLDEALKNFDLEAYKDKTIPLKFSREDFIKKVEDVLRTLNNNDRLLAEGYFGFTIEEGKMDGCPLPQRFNKQKMTEILEFVDDKKEFNSAIKELKDVVENFTLQNEFNIPESKDLSEKLTSITKVFPEFLSSVGKAQHETHAYTLDIHQLKALQEFIKDPGYEELSDKEKLFAKIAYLFHDIAKPEAEEDKEHPEKSALVVFKMLKRINFPQRQAERICNLINKHHWGENLKDNYIYEDTIKDIVFDFRRPGDYKIARMFAKADLKAVGNDFEKGKLDTCDKEADKITSKLHDIHKTGIYIPQTNIPKASEIKLKPAIISDDKGKTENVIVDMMNIDSLEAIGFDRGTDHKNFTAIIHAIDTYDSTVKQSIRDFELASKEGLNGIFSTSYVTLDNIRPYKEQKIGFILDVDPDNISLAYHRNLGSGVKKTLETYKDFLFNEKQDDWYGDYKFAREEFSNLVKEQLKAIYPDLKPEEIDDKYIEIYSKLINCRSLTNIRDRQIREIVKNALDKGIASQANENNEVVAYAPKVKAIFTLDKPENIPYELRKFAQQKDLPVVVLKPWLAQSIFNYAKEKPATECVVSAYNKEYIISKPQNSNEQKLNITIKTTYRDSIQEHLLEIDRNNNVKVIKSTNDRLPDAGYFDSDLRNLVFEIRKLKNPVND